MNRKFRRKRLTLSTGVDQQILTPNYLNNQNKFKSLKLRENSNNRHNILDYKWLINLLILTCLISLFKFVSSQTATDLLVSSSRNANADVNNFFHNLDSNHPFTNDFPNLSNNKNGQLVSTVQHLPNANSGNSVSGNSGNRNNNQKPINTNQNDQNKPTQATNKNRSTRNNRNNSNQNPKLNEPKNKRNNLTETIKPSTTTSSTSASTVSNVPNPKTQTTNKPTQTKKQNVNNNKNDSKIVAGNTKPDDLVSSSKNLEREPEVEEENLKVEASLEGSSSVEYITENEEKNNKQSNQEQAGENTGLRLNFESENNNEQNNENKDIYTDHQGEYLFNHPTYPPHKMQYESEIQRLDGKLKYARFS